jgi:hypothetical protein
MSSLFFLLLLPQDWRFSGNKFCILVLVHTHKPAIETMAILTSTFHTDIQLTGKNTFPNTTTQNWWLLSAFCTQFFTTSAEAMSFLSHFQGEAKSFESLTLFQGEAKSFVILTLFQGEAKSFVSLTLFQGESMSGCKLGQGAPQSRSGHLGWFCLVK